MMVGDRVRPGSIHNPALRAEFYKVRGIVLDMRSNRWGDWYAQVIWNAPLFSEDQEVGTIPWHDVASLLVEP
jgi:hypothetical protein